MRKYKKKSHAIITWVIITLVFALIFVLGLLHSK
jgi:hypothetical protein